jgi:hypothetical protein
MDPAEFAGLILKGSVPTFGGAGSHSYMTRQRVMEMEANSLRSGLMLEIVIYTRTQSKKGSYPLNYKVEYAHT